MLAGGQSRDSGADRGDLARDLVAEHHRHRSGPRSVDNGQVRVAEACSAHADEYLAGARRVEAEVADGRWPADLLEDGGTNVHAAKETAFAAPMPAPRRPVL